MNPRVTWTYSALMLLTLLTGAGLARGRQRSLGLTPAKRLGIGLGAFCGAMIGAKLPFVLADWQGLLSGSAWFANGKTIVFGLVGGYLGVEVAKSMLGVTVKTGDIFAVPVAGAVAVGRLGCFSAGCCFGKPTGGSWGVDFGDGILRHPTQLYESAFHATMLGVLLILEKRDLFHGQRIKFYFIAYLVYRFFSEWLRPEPIVGLGLTAYQWASLGLIVVFSLLWVCDTRSRNGAAARAPDGMAPAGEIRTTDPTT
jgi:phosphatidylglycerol:prolipoprotein diacylglycerol transferase